MKATKFTFLHLLLLALCISVKAQFGGGTGTEFEPYWIETATHLNNIKMTDDDGNYLYLNNAFIQLVDIDLGVAPYNEGLGWEPIGTKDRPFQGIFDGNDFSISNLFINRPLEDSLGLFGVTSGASINDVRLVNVSVTGNNFVGALAGSLRSSKINELGTIDETSSSGSVAGNNQVGGLIGFADNGLIRFSHSTCVVDGFDFVGGLVGKLDESDVYACYSLASITGNHDNVGGLTGRAYESEISRCYSGSNVEMDGFGAQTGGLVGYLYSNSTLINCYSLGSVTGEGTTGGLAGYNHGSAVTNCYSACTVTGSGGYVGGLVGRSDGTITGSYWDMTVSGLGEPGLGDGRTTDEMTYDYAENTFEDWNFSTIWIEDPDIGFGYFNSGYPYLDWQHNPQQFGFAGGSGTEGDPYLVASASHLNSVRLHKEAWYLQTANIDLGVFPWNEDEGWDPIGENTLSGKFKGHYNGDNYIINHLTINHTGDYHGLFGYLLNASISNVWLENILISGRDYVGALTGKAENTGIEGCYVSGSLSGRYYFGGLAGETISSTAITNCETDVEVSGSEYAGGLVGQCTSVVISGCPINGDVEITGNYAGGLVAYAVSTEISNCSNVGSVSGLNNTGGLVGIQSWSTVDRCFTTGNVTGTQYTGGLVGFNWNSSSVSNSYSRSQVTGNSSYLGGFTGYNVSGNSVTNCYSTGVVNGLTGSQGFIGVGGGTVINSFWDTETSGDAGSGGGTGRTTTQMKSLAGFTDETVADLTAAWDFVGNFYDDETIEDDWDIDGTFNNGYPFLSYQKERIEWTGANNSDPSQNANWSSGSAPLPADNILVLATAVNDLVVNRTPALPLYYNSLFIESGGTGEIAAGKALTVTGFLYNEGALEIKSDATGTGSLIHSSQNVNANIERYITGSWETWDAGWHIIGSPVATQAIVGFETEGEDNDYDFFGWDENTNTWMNYKAEGFEDWNGSTIFNPGQGYLISYQQTQSEMAFSGTLNVSNISLSNLSFTDEMGNGWHLLGNPFASAIAWNNGNWALNNVAGTAKIWSETGKSYTDISADDIIPSSQGFMVQVSEADNGLTIPAASRTHNSQAWYKEGNIQSISLVASEINESSFQESNILVNPDATDGFDFEFDSRFLPGYAPQFYSVLNNEKLSTNCLNEIGATTVITFGFVKNQASDFSIRLTETFPDLTIYLTDLKTNYTQNLNENPVYFFTSMDGDNPERFLLKFGLVGIPETQENEIFQAFACGQTLFVTNPFEGKANIAVYNLPGQQVFSTILPAQSNEKFILSLPTGWYLVQLVSDRSAMTKKIFIQ